MKKLLILLLLAACPLTAQYNCQILPDYGGYTKAWDINDNGYIVGQSGGLAVAWTDGIIQALEGISSDEQAALAVNDLGQVVGTGWTTGGTIHAIMWTDGIPTDLGAHTPDAWATAYDINNSGLVVGSSSDYMELKAILWDTKVSTDIIDLGSLVPGEWAEAYSINESGQIVGRATNGAGLMSAFVITPDAGVWNRDDDLDGINDLMYEIVIPYMLGATAWGINDAGEIIGEMYTDTGQWRAFLWTFAASEIDLGNMGGTGSHALGINGDGKVVGYIDTPTRTRAFRWNEEMNGYDDQFSDGKLWVLEHAQAINTRGQVVGMAGAGQEKAAYCITPTGGGDTFYSHGDNAGTAGNRLQFNQ